MQRNNGKAFVLALTATTLLTTGLARAAGDSTPSEKAQKSDQAIATKDFGKLSADGSNAFQDLTLTRIAIFDGRTDDAKKYVQRAETAFDKAKRDETVFTKAEADLKPPAKTAPGQQTVGAASTATDAPDKVAGDQKSAEQLKKPISWLPVDGALSINEDYTGNPEKTAAVAEANKHLKTGDRNGAMEKLKLADLDLDVTLAVVPLEQTIDDVHQAASMISDGKYYEASQLLRKAQDGERFDVTSIIAKPSKK
jgi:hypothetical protein